MCDIFQCASWPMPWNTDNHIKSLDAIKNSQPFFWMTISHPGVTSDKEQVAHKSNPLTWQIQEGIAVRMASTEGEQFNCPLRAVKHYFLLKSQVGQLYFHRWHS